MAKFKTNDGVALDYHIYGEGQPIVLIAGYSGNQATWSSQIKALVSAGMQVITYDRRNHGESASVAYGMRISRHGQDLAELISFLHLNQPILLGHSMGASTIWAYISLYGDDNLRAVITEDQVPKMLRDSNWPFGLLDADISTLVTVAKQLPQTKLIQVDIPIDIKRQIGKNYRPFDFVYNEPLLIDSIVQDWRDVVRREYVPHLFVAGDKSPLWSAEHAQLSAELTQYGESYVIADVGHMPHIEGANEFNQIVLKFIDQV
ncbi:alpha/beta hydrolase [Leuconostoc carnosum]|uniref:Non-heme chloride peroxidase n=2 Tax=Leuconostoc carnosum TaxID=1252 RepID=K0DDK4_LEUCJ|nr:alpha/beta hydrolase [Leuconostoc carnosum]AFT82086.1 non-heme chloride peroxidase [Leuconostoc carnosum JB16]KAA8328653.1 alpha/beta hydrolase [Leuconostoc carnosum]QEA33872.1 alpha/beta hydrolase [Leuconostoc carnosum]